MSSPPTPLSAHSCRHQKLVYVAKTEHDAQLLSGQLDCQIDVQPSSEQDCPPFLTVSERPDVSTFQASECPKRCNHRNASNVSL